MCYAYLYKKVLIRHQILCDYMLAPKRYSYTKGYLLDVYKLKIFTVLAQITIQQLEKNVRCHNG